MRIGGTGGGKPAREQRSKVVASLAALGTAIVLAVGVIPAIAAGGVPSVLVPNGGALLGVHATPRSPETKQQATDRFEHAVGHKIGIDHQYYQWSSAIPTSYERWTVDHGRIPFINWKAPSSWTQVASGAEDAWIAQRADAFKAFRDPVYLSFHHEPENDPTYGSPSDFAAAFRRVVDVFRARGVTNVAFVWTMMSWTFEPRSGRVPTDWYPGDNYVDLLGADGYNWFPGKAGSEWRSFATVFDPARRFALDHGKPWMVVETGAQEDPALPGRKGDWFRGMLNTAKQWPDLKAIVYYDSGKDYPWWVDSSSSSLAGFSEVAASSWFSGGGTPSPQVSPSPNPSPSSTPSPPPSPSPTASPSSTAAPTSSPSPSPSPTSTPPVTSSPSPSPSATTSLSLSPSPSPSLSSSPSSTMSPSPSPTSSSSPSPTPTLTPDPSPTPTPSPSPTPKPPRGHHRRFLFNSFDGGVKGTRVVPSSSGGHSGDPFDTASHDRGGSITYDDRHAWGRGMAAKVSVGRGENASVTWEPSLARPAVWFGRVFVWFESPPKGDARIVQANETGGMKLSIDVLRSGRVRIVDRSGRSIATTERAIARRAWTRIEWMIDPEQGVVELRVYRHASSWSAPAIARSALGAAIGSGPTEVEIGRTGSQRYDATFWIDEPALSLVGFLGPSPRRG